MGGPPAPFGLHAGSATAASAGGAYFGGGGLSSGPPSFDGSRVTLSNAASLNPAASLGFGRHASASSGGGFAGGQWGGSSSSMAEFNERLSQLGSGRIDDLDF